jgi:hypothetical protein
MSHREKEGYGKKLRSRTCGKTELDAEASCQMGPLNVETSWEEEGKNFSVDLNTQFHLYPLSERRR